MIQAQNKRLYFIFSKCNNLPDTKHYITPGILFVKYKDGNKAIKFVILDFQFLILWTPKIM